MKYTYLFINEDMDPSELSSPSEIDIEGFKSHSDNGYGILLRLHVEDGNIITEDYYENVWTQVTKN